MSFLYAVGPNTYARISATSYLADNTTIFSNENFAPPVVIAAIPASPGASWTSVSQDTATDATNSLVSITSAITVSNFAGVEDVTVPYNGGTTYKACLKFSVLNYTPVGGTGGQLTGNTMSWFCKGVGLVKRQRVNLSYTTTSTSPAMNSTITWQLTGLTTAAP